MHEPRNLVLMSKFVFLVIYTSPLAHFGIKAFTERRYWLSCLPESAQGAPFMNFCVWCQKALLSVIEGVLRRISAPSPVRVIDLNEKAKSLLTMRNGFLVSYFIVFQTSRAYLHVLDAFAIVSRQYGRSFPNWYLSCKEIHQVIHRLCWIGYCYLVTSGFRNTYGWKRVGVLDLLYNFHNLLIFNTIFINYLC